MARITTKKRGRALGDAARATLKDRSGNVLILFGLCALPTIGAVGIGTDYWRGLSYKARLDAAADSAAIAAITAAQA